MKPSSIGQSSWFGVFLLATLLGNTGLAQAQVVGDRVLPCDARCRRWLGLEERPVFREPPVYRARPGFRERAYLEDDGYYLEEPAARMRGPREREVWGRPRERAQAWETFVRPKRPKQIVSSRPKSTISKSKKVADRNERPKRSSAIATKVTSPALVAPAASQDPVTAAPTVSSAIDAVPAAAMPQTQTPVEPVAKVTEANDPAPTPAPAAPEETVARETMAPPTSAPAPPEAPVDVAALPQQVNPAPPAPLNGISPPVSPLLDLTNGVTSEEDRKILQLLRRAASDLALGDNDMGAGDNVAEDIPLTPLPEAVIARKPFFKNYQFFVSDGDAVLVTPKTRRVVKVYSSKAQAGAGPEASTPQQSPSR
ncbi:MAG: hypothetical protein JWM36_1515 [Hyphomicrobiales bacterium]|nr:hypothetical protein [Hyphomicrobiales bacterium]